MPGPFPVPVPCISHHVTTDGFGVRHEGAEFYLVLQYNAFHRNKDTRKSLRELRGLPWQFQIASLRFSGFPYARPQSKGTATRVQGICVVLYCTCTCSRAFLDPLPSACDHVRRPKMVEIVLRNTPFQRADGRRRVFCHLKRCVVMTSLLSSVKALTAFRTRGTTALQLFNNPIKDGFNLQARP